MPNSIQVFADETVKLAREDGVPLNIAAIRVAESHGCGRETTSRILSELGKRGAKARAAHQRHPKVESASQKTYWWQIY